MTMTNVEVVFRQLLPDDTLLKTVQRWCRALDPHEEAHWHVALEKSERGVAARIARRLGGGERRVRSAARDAERAVEDAFDTLRAQLAS